MRVYKTLGSKQQLFDKGQAVLTASFFFAGAVFENIYFLLICPVIVFAVTFIIKEKYFSGKPEWWIYVLRMIASEKVFYTRHIKDRIEIKR